MASTSAPTSPDGRLDRRFAGLLAEHRCALVPYVTAGYPSPDAALDVLRTVEDAGADVIELGVPFSDPLADGPTIQRASQRAIEEGMTLDGVLELLRRFRSTSDTPVVLFSYLNPVFRHGVDRFVEESVDAGADGVLLTDLPVGGDPELEERLENSPLALVRLVAPTTTKERARTIADRAQGFVYFISRLGVTGARRELAPGLEEEVTELRRTARLPVAVGFGISSAEQAARVAHIADGVVVGSALIDALDAGGTEGAMAFLGKLRSAMDAATGERA